MKAEKKERRVQKTVYFDPEVWMALEAHMKRERIDNVSIATNDAVKYSLFPEYRGDREADLSKLFGQLSFSLAEHRKKTGRDMMLLQEMILQFIKLFFVHTHQIPDSGRKAAEAQAEIRLDSFMNSLIKKFTTE